jgi:hypothetical protein
MAGQQIDKLGDSSATDEQRQTRKRRLLKGPTEFRDMRVDLPKPKGTAPAHASKPPADPTMAPRPQARQRRS